ncbi:MAG: radical SAM protein [Bacillota bacterium]|nr:radical SAM protein [Bacillota bacterium]MDI7249791.1 radical SAM protein [Bacillota bacterium]
MDPSVVAWEATRACNLVCRHCRAEAVPACDPAELTSAEVRLLLEDVASFCRPTFIITGGEPLLRPDVLELARYGTSLGLRVVMSTNGTTLTADTVRAIREAGILAISVSIDGPDAASHDAFRGVPGAFAASLEGMRLAREAGLPFQVNTTVTRHNVDALPRLLELARQVGALTWDVFLLVPTGRASAEDEIPPARYEQVLEWLLDRSAEGVRVKVTCGPMYARLWIQRGGQGRRPQGCMAGDGFAFISRTGKVYPCGYFPREAGDIRERPFSAIYRESPLFLELRDPGLLRGKCGRCEFRRACRGCRARALGTTGDYLAEEPYCTYQPPLRERSAQVVPSAGCGAAPPGGGARAAVGGGSPPATDGGLER